MGCFHLARIGAWGEVGRFRSVDATCYPRGSRVVLRTARGVETGEILAPPDDEFDDDVDGRADGTILRGVTVADDLLSARQEKNRAAAMAACEEAIRQRRLPVALVDAEPLLDGRTLVFYFLGPALPELDELTAELAETYEGEVQFRKFSDAVNAGCGPDCGTKDAGGCGSCADQGCAVASACATKKRPSR